MQTHVLGFPRFGVNRELKKALEGYWIGAIPAQELIATCELLKKRHWQVQKDAGLSLVATGDFSLYDHMLDTTALLGAVPERFEQSASGIDLDLYFKMARGDAKNNVAAMEMTKWFNTNYHYIVPEFTPSLRLSLSSKTIIEDTKKAIELGYKPKPALVGPITYLSLAKDLDGANRWERLEEITAIYATVLSELGSLCEWIQIDEPILCADMSPEAQAGFAATYAALNKAAGKAKLLLTTYFERLDENLNLALASGCAGLHLDLVRGKDALEGVLERLPQTMTLSVGLVDGRNIWKTDLAQALETLRMVASRIGLDRLMVGSACSLLHAPVDLAYEKKLAPELKSWMAFAVQKCREITVLGDVLTGKGCAAELKENAIAMTSRRASPKTKREDVRKRSAGVTPQMLQRKSAYPVRKQAQAWLDLPLFPTTTIGSFPQTSEIRNARQQFRKGEMTAETYEDFLKNEIRKTIKIQEDLGLDVLVHGEAERNDMVEYFGQQLDGFCFTENGWVQSYGSRCVKPPVIYGDVARRIPMTVGWITYAQSLTKKPMKGMLTGPVTILCWSFVRDDMHRSEVCKQIGLAIRDEVVDLEKSGIRIIQIDEAALSEGMPIRQADAAAYLRWAVDAFRLTSSGVEDKTQIHSHMCYSEFNKIIRSIAEMDADVISIEASRSKMELLEAFQQFDYPNEIGPGVYDIHSPRVPSESEILRLLQNALLHITKERLWVNPDCGLKTRAWPETLASLTNMVAATQTLRKLHGAC
ncbi:TPA: 5-methyltetrahydropteroyltriglutamate--homocysteine S-methyltransferase [Candidatus Sumerlaeota bacterium]|nr:5-methyltetrahydropteroyltriglutamate--homocysteine S-methyltransferase [Candidatus Sumerlaeota bacterium]